MDAEITSAQKAGDKVKLGVLRVLKSEIRYKEIDLKHPLTDEETILVLSSSVKKRKESIEEFKKGNRPDLVSKEEAELAIVQSYLPAELTESELSDIVKSTIADVGATSNADLGKVMKSLMPKVRGRADGKKVNALVAAQLGG
ncbi:MAG: GatB/YqeY domain-containing protein [candidate division Zixibacteria bacterium]|nr:GatB/YqeY domain-containing protein [candidate division Zixibacteria bacterium]MCI0595087.1 GatB/YqeY domain-containing protein [candidate division Zixibacteria bacterium]